MRTKTLLLTAALSAAGVAASMAQVYSVNVVGYVNQTIKPGGWAILSNPLNNGDNKINTIMSLPDGSDGVIVFRWDGATQNFLDSYTFVTSLGWLSAGEANPTLAPGEAFFLQNTLTTPLNLTFVGEVPQGDLSTTIYGGNRFSLVASKVPQAAKLGDANTQDSLQFPAQNFDLVYVWDATLQNYLDSYTYLDNMGWLSAAEPTNFSGPNIPVGTGFWIQRSGTEGNWTRNFTVN